MKFLSPKIHGIIDYLVVAFLLCAPTLFGLTGRIVTFTYVLAGVHLLLTILTNYEVGLFKLIPFPLHGVVELIVSLALIVLSYTLFKNNPTGKMFYLAFGAAVLLVWLITDYKNGPVKDIPKV
jgi:hypothetical protein